MKNCNCSNTSQCTQQCNAQQELDSSKVIYDGPILGATGIEACDTMNTALSKIDEVLNALNVSVTNNTVNLKSATEEILNINSAIVNLNNEVNSIKNDITDIYEILETCCTTTTIAP